MAQTKSIVQEIGIFSVFMSVVTGVGAYFTLTGLNGAPDLIGLPRALVLGVPLLVIAAAFATSGVLVLTTRKPRFVRLTAAIGVVLGLCFLAFGATNPAVLLTPVAFVVYAIPALLVIRGRQALRELSSPPPTPGA
ncbi:MAG: hypothetical protein HY903_03395 [Deltaproteobacteria bacterium]|nr:hypothetical protein [Deltaproteobacteria bacterium]